MVHAFKWKKRKNHVSQKNSRSIEFCLFLCHLCGSRVCITVGCIPRFLTFSPEKIRKLMDGLLEITVSLNHII